MDNYNSFDRLVLGISNNERIDLLKKLEAATDPEKQNVEASYIADPDDQEHDLSTKFKGESFLLRIWMHLKALFSANDVEFVYNQYLVSSLAKNIEKNYPNLIDYKHGLLTTDFYNKLYELKNVAAFFKPGISVYEEKQGSFFVFLGSLFVPELSERIDNEVSPYKLGFDREVTGELRSSLIRKMEEIIQSIPSTDKTRLYTAVRSIEWLKAFTHLPFERLTSRFISLVSGSYTCPLDSASQDLATFAKVLCNGKRIQTEILEALFLFSEQSQQDEIDSKTNNIPEATETTKAISKEETLNINCAEYLKKSLEQISLIKMFITTIPVHDLTAVANNSSIWIPEQLDGVEDWFVKYKNQWRKLFDQKWECWLRDKRKFQTHEKIKELFSTEDFPHITNRPWLEIWDGLEFSKDYALGFIYAFFEQLYPTYSKLFKVIMVEGEFTQRENRIEFTDTYNLLNHLSQSTLMLNEQLSIKGVYGASFDNIIKESIRTIQGKAKIDSLMSTIEHEASSLIAQFADACRTMQLLLGGILTEAKNPRYDTLANISSIQGKSNSIFREQLHAAKAGFIDALELLKELETIEITSRK